MEKVEGGNNVHGYDQNDQQTIILFKQRQQSADMMHPQAQAPQPIDLNIQKIELQNYNNTQNSLPNQERTNRQKVM